MYILDIVIYFTIYAFIGWSMETVFNSITEKMFVNRGFLFGPFCPLYGFTAILVIHLSRFISIFSGNYFLINIGVSIIVVTAVEYISGFYLEKIFNCKWWDYSNYFANCQGNICLQYSLLWGLLIYVLIKVIHPLFSELIFIMPELLKIYTVILIFIYFFTDTIKSVNGILVLKKVINDPSDISIDEYNKMIIKNKRLFFAYPNLRKVNGGIIFRDIEDILKKKNKIQEN